MTESVCLVIKTLIKTTSTIIPSVNLELECLIEMSKCVIVVP